MRAWFSSKRHRSINEKHSRLEENGEGGESEAEEKQRGTEAAMAEGAPKVPSKTLTSSMTPAPLPSQEIPPEDVQSPIPAPTHLDPDDKILALVGELEAVREFQASHQQERRKDLRSCQECLKSMKAMRDNVQAIQSRLWQVEAKLGLRVPPQGEEEEELEGEGSLGAPSLG